jgi:hypothetical protein
MTRDIDVFFGEFLISPIPLELSLNYCSHKCAYCFANLNDPERSVNVGAVARFLQDLPQRNTLQALLMKAGYPTLISNRVDPFAVTNYRIALPLMETMTGMGIPLAIQTKGGKGIPEALAFLPPSAGTSTKRSSWSKTAWCSAIRTTTTSTNRCSTAGGSRQTGRGLTAPTFRNCTTKSITAGRARTAAGTPAATKSRCSLSTGPSGAPCARR